MGTSVLCPADRVDAAFDAANEAVGVLAGNVGLLDAGELARFVPRLGKLIARCDSVKLSALAAADARRVGDLTGAATTADWVAEATGDKRGKARHDLELAAKLGDLDEVADALAQGAVSKTQAEVLAGATGATGDEQRELLDAAGSQTVTELARSVDRFNRRRDQPAPKLVPSVTIINTPQGLQAQVTLDVLGGELFTTAVTAAADQLSFEKGTSLAERRAAGLVAVCRYFLEHADTSKHRFGRPHVICTIPIDTLVSGCGDATLGSGAIIDAATARQFACDAGISRLITGADGEPLDVGRTTRTIPAGIAKILLVEDMHCRWPACESPAWSCEAHHVKFWEGPGHGETKIANLALLCWHHHHLVHKDHQWRLHLEPDTRRLHVYDDNTLIGSTDPPGRTRPSRPTGPAAAPAPRVTPTSETEQTQLFDTAS